MTKLKIDIYECVIQFYIFETNKEVRTQVEKILKKYKIKEEVSDSCGSVIPQFDIYYMIMSKEKNYINTFFHELSHVVDFILLDREINDSEARAYLQGIIGEKLIKLI